MKAEATIATGIPEIRGVLFRTPTRIVGRTEPAVRKHRVHTGTVDSTDRGSGRREAPRLLESGRIEVSKPSFDEFSLQIRERTRDIIQKKTARESHADTEKVEVKEEGWCSDAEYETRTIWKERPVDQYLVRLDVLSKFWNDKIDASTKQSLKTASMLINRQIREATKDAHSKIKRRHDLYVERMQHSLKVAERGGEKREERPETVRTARDRHGDQTAHR